MVASTTDRVRSPSSRSTVPVYLAKRPRTFETTMCRIEKLMPEWAASMFQLFVVMGSSSVAWVRSGSHRGGPSRFVMTK